MFAGKLTCLLAGAALIQQTTAGYVLSDDYDSSHGTFFTGFTPFTEADPTGGYVKYTSYETALASELIASSANYNNASYLGVDYTSAAAATTKGRQSVRISSKKSFNKGLFIADIAHMPGGICGVWPAFWLLGPDWPRSGEIDILEGVNAASVNTMTLHTSPGCKIQKTGFASSSTAATTDCDTKSPDQTKNAGCAIKTTNTQTYGEGFNAIGGGVYATDWTSSGISVYFFPRNSIPADIISNNPNPKSWGTPLAAFAGDCNIDSHFQNMNIVFDTTFCGHWAGEESVWAQGGCAKKAKTCNAYVQQNPKAFEGAFWLVNYVKVFQEGGSQVRKRGVNSRFAGP